MVQLIDCLLETGRGSCFVGRGDRRVLRLSAGYLANFTFRVKGLIKEVEREKRSPYKGDLVSGNNPTSKASLKASNWNPPSISQIG